MCVYDELIVLALTHYKALHHGFFICTREKVHVVYFRIRSSNICERVNAASVNASLICINVY